ncbi:MAG: IMP dehydrogenase, partial [Xanthomonadales bacterium]
MQLIGEALTFDDVSLIPGYSEVLPGDVRLDTRLTTGIHLKAPLISAAMDTVTEARLAIAMAQEGGIGVIHKNMSLEQQARQVHTVKKYEAGVIKDPITVTPDATIREVLELTHRHNISGVPVVDTQNIAQNIQQLRQMIEDEILQNEQLTQLREQLATLTDQLAELQRTYEALTRLADSSFPPQNAISEPGPGRGPGR